LAQLTSYDWPGNVRELENTLTRATVLARGPVIAQQHLNLKPPGEDSNGMDSEAQEETLADAERSQVQRVLQKTQGNKRQAARILDISRSRLDRLIGKHGIVVPDLGQDSTDP
jgi:DNA-binding NtrC family response regulator